MAENLVIVESPTKAKKIQEYLGKEKYVVKSSEGHIRDLHDNELSVDIKDGFKPEYVVPAGKRKLVSELKKLAADSRTVWLASDADREGEAISWHLYETLGLKKENTRRITFQEITKSAILDAVENPRDIDMDLVDAQQARRVLDRLVGFELSPVLWRKVQPKLSAGRVQSVALRLIVDREREIQAFERERFYRIEALFHPENTGTGTFLKAVLDRKFGTMEEAREFLGRCIGAQFAVSDIENKEGTRTPAAPFTTSTLQQEASRKLHLPVSQTMRIAQNLYESGLITYMRTDSTNLSGLAINAAKEYICREYGDEYSKVRNYKTKSKGAQEAHEAIRPTYIDRVSIDGTAQEKKLYELIWKRTVASQMADAKTLKTDVRLSSDKTEGKFTAQATKIQFDGFLRLYIEGRDDDQQQDDDEMPVIPDIRVGDRVQQVEMTAECRFTAAPPRYSEATIIKKIEELGIGRPSTYSTIVGTLTRARGYVTIGDKPGTEVKVTDLKMRDFSEILDYNFTANVENELGEIAEGELKWNRVIGYFYAPFHKTVEECLHNGEYSHVSRELGTDPSDGQPLVAKFGKFGPYVQKGEGEGRQFANLAPGQLIETLTLEEALKLFQLPRTVGEYKGIPIICTKGRFGPYLKYGDRNVSLPKKSDPLSITLDECKAIIDESENKKANEIIAEFKDSGITVINGNYGPYIKFSGGNYKIPPKTDAAKLTEADCKSIIETTEPTGRRRSRGRK